LVSANQHNNKSTCLQVGAGNKYEEETTTQGNTGKNEDEIQEAVVVQDWRARFRMFNYPVADKTTEEKNQRPEQNDNGVHAYNRFD